MKKRVKKNERTALFLVANLLFSFFAFAFIVSLSMEVVSGAGTSTTGTGTNQKTYTLNDLMAGKISNNKNLIVANNNYYTRVKGTDQYVLRNTNGAKAAAKQFEAEGKFSNIIGKDPIVTTFPDTLRSADRYSLSGTKFTYAEADGKYFRFDESKIPNTVTEITDPKGITNAKKVIQTGEKESIIGNIGKTGTSTTVTPSVLGDYVGDYNVDVTFKSGEFAGKELSGTLIKNKDGSFELLKSDGTKVHVNPNDVESVTTEGVWGGMGVGFLGNLAEGVTWGLGAFFTLRQALPLLGVEEETSDAISKAALGGIVAGKATIGILQQWGGASKNTQYIAGGAMGAMVALIIISETYKVQKQKIVTYSCNPWEAPSGGHDCEKCNEQGSDLPCSTYQCKSLGQACELVNEEGSEYALCVWVDRNDVDYPIMIPMDSALMNDNYKYDEYAVSPPDKGVRISYTDPEGQIRNRCAPAFTPVSFGFELNEPAQCKIDVTRQDEFDDMRVLMNHGLFAYNHTFSLSLPGSAILESENISVENGGNYSLYVRCKDKNGNYNPAHFVFNFCIDDGPDTTPPLIMGTEKPNDSPIGHGITSVIDKIYTNEPVSMCKWSHKDQSYERMENNITDCTGTFVTEKIQTVYGCNVNLTGLKDNFENDFYFRCSDTFGNINSESYKFTLIGTTPLAITYAGPNDTVIKDATESVKVTLEAKTFSGYKEGEANCYFEKVGTNGEKLENEYPVIFSDTSSYIHKMDLWLNGGIYTYNISCHDLGANSDVETVRFEVNSDFEEPLIVRAYHEKPNLVLITNEEAKCVYSTTDCTYLFGDGIAMNVVEESIHYTPWDSQKTLYIKCKDSYGKEPGPEECSMIVTPFEKSVE